MTDIIVTLPKPIEEVESYTMVAPDIYEAEFVSVEKKIGPSKTEFLSLKPVIYDKNGKKLATLMPENVSLAESALWKLKRILEAMGYHEPKGRKLNVNKLLLYKRFNAEVIIEEYEVLDESGKKVTRKKNSINDYFPINQKISQKTVEEVKEESVKVENEEEISFE